MGDTCQVAKTFITSLRNTCQNLCVWTALPLKSSGIYLSIFRDCPWVSFSNALNLRYLYFQRTCLKVKRYGYRWSRKNVAKKPSTKVITINRGTQQRTFNLLQNSNQKPALISAQAHVLIKNSKFQIIIQPFICLLFVWYLFYS